MTRHFKEAVEFSFVWVEQSCCYFEYIQSYGYLLGTVLSTVFWFLFGTQEVKRRALLLDGHYKEELSIFIFNSFLKSLKTQLLYKEMLKKC